MADATRPRAVSGEIMTDPLDAAAAQPPPGGRHRRGRRHRRRIHHAALRAATRRTNTPGTSVVDRIGSCRRWPAWTCCAVRRKQPRRKSPRAAVRCSGLLGIGLAVAAFWVSGGHALVRGSPFIGADTPHSALRISGVTSRVDDSGARPILLVDGEAANDGASSRRTCRRSTSPSPAMTAASPATGWGHRAARWRQAKHSPFPAVSMCLRTG